MPPIAILLAVALLSSCESDTSESDAVPGDGTTDEASAELAEDTTVDDDSVGESLGGAVVFSVNDKYTLFDDGPGTVILAGKVEIGVLRPGDGLELLDGGSETGTTIIRITVGAPSVEVDSLAAGEFGNILVSGELAQFKFDSKLVRPTS